MQVLSVLPGRIRFSDAAIGNRDLASFMNAYVDNLYGVTICKVNSVTRTLLVQYDNEKTSYERLRESIQQTLRTMTARQDTLKYDLASYHHYLSVVQKRGSSWRNFLRFAMVYLLFRFETPLSRISLGRNLPVLEVASAVTIISGYPPLRKLFRKSTQKIPGNSDLWLNLTALALTFIRQSSNGVLVLALKELNEFIKFSADAESQRRLTQTMNKNFRMVWVDDGQQAERLVPAETLRPGDVFIVHPGELVPADADVIGGQAVINSIYYNGQPIVSHIDSGNRVYEGTVVISGQLRARVIEKPGRSDKPDLPYSNLRIQKRVDRYQDRIGKAALVAAAISYLLTGNFLRAMSILLVATPSGAGVALSTGIRSYVAVLNKYHIYLRNPNVMERIVGTSQVVFDKTGTLTQGIMKIRKIESYRPDYPAHELLRIAAACEVDNYHPIALTLQDSVGRDYDVTKVDHSVLIPSAGVRSDYDGHRILIGSPGLLRNEGVDLSAAAAAISGYERELLTPVLISIDHNLAGLFVLEDILRPGSRELITNLKRQKIPGIAIMTGDRADKADATARELGIDKVYSECDYHDKLDIIREIQARDTVMMVGDGINDVLAMKQADVSLSLANSAADRVKLASDCIIFEDDLDRLPQLLELSQEAYRYAKQSLLVSQLFSLTSTAIATFTFLDPFRAKSLNTINSLIVLLLNKRIEFITPRRKRRLLTASSSRPVSGEGDVARRS